VRVEFGDGWGLVRASNTQPVLVLRFEAMTEKRLQEIKQLIEGKVQSAVSSLKGS
jgi:phosphomannomutase/phosphoglucomutase